jgi:hypothetical protein
MFLYVGIAFCVTGFIVLLTFALKPNLLNRTPGPLPAQEPTASDLDARINPPTLPLSPGKAAILNAEGNTPNAHLRQARFYSPYRVMRLWVNVFFVFGSFGFGVVMMTGYTAMFNAFPHMSENLGPLFGALLVSAVIVMVILRQLTLLMLDMADLLIDAGLRAKMQGENHPRVPAK